jgi:hypothetical protein
VQLLPLEPTKYWVDPFGARPVKGTMCSARANRATVIRSGGGRPRSLFLDDTAVEISCAPKRSGFTIVRPRHPLSDFGSSGPFS